MYHAACKVEFQPFKRSYSQLTFLQRSPAYRARSWAWSSDEEADAGGSGDDDTAAAAAAAAAVAAAARSAPPASNTPPADGVQIYRPTAKSRSNLFVRLVGR